jgi:hypothetical protein
MLTVLTGVITFILGQAVLKFVLEPILDHKRAIGEAGEKMIQYANVYSNSAGIRRRFAIDLKSADTPERRAEVNKLSERWEERERNTEQALRLAAAHIVSTAYAIPFKKFFVFWNVIEPYDLVRAATREMIGLSNSQNPLEIRVAKHSVEQQLNIDLGFGGYKPSLRLTRRQKIRQQYLQPLTKRIIAFWEACLSGLLQ